MKFPTHVLLDWHSSNANETSQYWFIRHVSTRQLSPDRSFFFHFILKKKLKQPSWSLNISKTNSKFTISHSSAKPTFSKLKNFFSVNSKDVLPKKPIFTDSKEKEVFLHINMSNKNLFKNSIIAIFKNTSIIRNSLSFENSNTWSHFDINFLRKEKIYTKLKYSRVPQYDIVSGGVAALFAGFLGFLICEKFGFELLDSGDFYILFMYLVFICFFCKLFLNLYTHNNNSWSCISPKWFFIFYKNLLCLFFKKIKTNNYR